MSQKANLGKLERDVWEEGNRIEREKYCGTIKPDRPVTLEEILGLGEDAWLY